MYSIQETLRFPPVDGLTERLAQAFGDSRHPSYITHSLQTLFAQRTYQIACAYEDGNDANALRADPLYQARFGAAPPG